MIKYYLILISLLFSTNILADNQTDSDAIFDWAEKNYPQYFSTDGEVRTYNSIEYKSNTYIARRYLSTNVYIGTSNGMVYYFSEDIFNGLLEVNSIRKFLDVIAAEESSTPRFNDTGAINCNNNTLQKKLTCPVTDFPGQDAEYGRDITNNDSTDGLAGFSFTKLDAQGNALEANNQSWSCVKDNTTGLTWEVKTDDRGLRNKYWYYTWLDSSTTPWTGTANGGFCNDKTNCDTEKYIQLVNSESLCGASDWRLPTVQELSSLISFDRYDAAIDEDYFPNTQSKHYWSVHTKMGTTTHAWYVHFYNGQIDSAEFTEGKYVRLVRSE